MIREVLVTDDNDGIKIVGITMVMTACIRCGKVRILDRIWEERVGISLLTHTDTVCPDADCQKLVEALLKDRHDTNEARNKESLARREENRKKSVESRRSKLGDVRTLKDQTVLAGSLKLKHKAL